MNKRFLDCWQDITQDLQNSDQILSKSQSKDTKKFPVRTIPMVLSILLALNKGKFEHVGTWSPGTWVRTVESNMN